MRIVTPLITQLMLLSCHLQVDVMYAHIRYGSTFPQWLVREAFLAANPEAEGMGLVPCDSTIQRAIDNFRNNNN